MTADPRDRRREARARLGAAPCGGRARVGNNAHTARSGRENFRGTPDRGEARMFYVIAHFVIRPIFWVLFRPRVSGREHVPATGPVILASNHLSFIDSIAIPIVAPRRVTYLAKAEYFTRSGVGGWLSKAL